MTDTSDTAIEALAAAPWAYASADLSAMLIALQAERKAGWVARVKPLEWVYHGGDEYCAVVLDSGLRYFYSSDGWWLDGRKINYMPRTATAAQKRAAAQADYTASVLAALTPNTEAKP